jgi:PTS system galactitol-specific IIA component
VKDESASSPGTQVRPRVELSIFDLDAADDVEVLTALAEQAETAGWVRPSFKTAVLEREGAYPTGLPTLIPVAIPHADVEHVLKSGLGIASLKNAVRFGEMGGADRHVDARVVVLILVSDPGQQVELLTKLVDLFQQPGWFEKIEAASGVEDLVEVFTRLLDDSSQAVASA